MTLTNRKRATCRAALQQGREVCGDLGTGLSAAVHRLRLGGSAPVCKGRPATIWRNRRAHRHACEAAQCRSENGRGGRSFGGLLENEVVGLNEPARHFRNFSHLIWSRNALAVHPLADPRNRQPAHIGRERLKADVILRNVLREFHTRLLPKVGKFCNPIMGRDNR